MSSFSVEASSLLINTIRELPMSGSCSLPIRTMSWAEKNTSSSLNGVVSLSNYKHRTTISRYATKYLARVASFFIIQLTLATSVLASLGMFNPVAYSMLFTCLFIVIITRLCVAIKTLRQLNLCKKTFSGIIISISDKLVYNSGLSTQELMPISNAAKATTATVTNQLSRQKISIAGATIALISVIGLTIGLGLLLASIYGGSCIGCASVIGGISATQLLFIISGSLLGFSAIWHFGILSNNIYRRMQQKQTHHQLETVIKTLAEERMAAAVKTSLSKN
ncbi:hypothetical protein CLAVI_000421 [Candidatus Clavichlamydia salmonicola]|uniref:hypothetical protein n=1 Tax=Candidatus Clavichlamydia salmonicola TaxID=469812 RepID=UPI001891C81C|nr:hypothetical protein [Candidatus Clavichlamydia salmonicola]MBF5050802.1 hypothetical protein [Candidatus Clavichlamydia salmonicola]